MDNWIPGNPDTAHPPQRDRVMRSCEGRCGYVRRNILQPSCGAVSPRGFVCTLPPGHGDNHVACLSITQASVDKWYDEKPTPPEGLAKYMGVL